VRALAAVSHGVSRFEYVFVASVEAEVELAGGYEQGNAPTVEALAPSRILRTPAALTPLAMSDWSRRCPASPIDGIGLSGTISSAFVRGPVRRNVATDAHSATAATAGDA
jgi:hypothetical protein